MPAVVRQRFCFATSASEISRVKCQMKARRKIARLRKAGMPMVRVLSVPTVGFIALLIPFALSGCSTAAPPIADTTRIALTPTKGQITMAARPGTPIGDLVPVDIGVANGTDEPYRIEPDQVFA